MKTVEMWEWRIQNSRGRWHTTRWHSTEEDMKRQHPEAVRVEGSKIERQILEPGDPLPNADLYPHGVLDFVKGIKPAKRQSGP